jgi:hypothetical protein
MGCEPGVVRGRPSTCPDVLRARIRLCRVPTAFPLNIDEGGGVRFIGMDIHRDFCEIAICEDGKVRSAGRIATSVAQLELFAQGLASDDVVALEATSGAGLVVDLLERQVARVLMANTRKLPQISRARPRPTGWTRGRSPSSPRPGCSRRCGRRVSRSARCGGCARREKPGARPPSREERGARRAGPQPVRATADQRLLRQGRPRVAGRPRAPGR